MVSITVFPATKPPSFAKSLPLTLQVPPHSTVRDVKSAISQQIPSFYVSRQKLSLRGNNKALSDEDMLTDLNIGDGAELAIKDLGPQVDWQTTFILEYIGPLILHPLFFHFPELCYGRAVQHSSLQKLVYAMVVIHFIKRELETLFVHRFSHATMPIFNIYRNSFHYYVFAGLFLAYSVYSPTYATDSPYIHGTIRGDPRFLLAGAAVWAFCEISNFLTHLTLRNLRPPNSKKRAIPYGYGFGLLTCPNYWFEWLGWVVIDVLTGSWSAYLYTAAATYMMLTWALKKHKTYKKEFGDKYPKYRKAMFPFIL